MAAEKGSKDVLEKVRNLIKLSQSDNVEEARTAAVKATQLMAQHKLVLVPQSELDRVNGVLKDVQKRIDEAKKDGTQKMLIGALVGMTLSGKGLL